DILDFDFLKAAGAGEKIRVAGNIPYYITAAIIERVILAREVVKDAFFTMQKEVGERITAVPHTKAYGSLTVFVNFYGQAKKYFAIGRKAFFPEPNVDSVFIGIDFKSGDKLPFDDEKFFFRVVKAGFSEKRKMLVNNLSKEFKTGKDTIAKILADSGVSEKARAEEVDIKGFSSIAAALSRV
ncbi:MAG TPA: 16S rRNA (adenine(1518)-N(6)/adenine(1519)-N(6))-dimethyltransferase, partial [Firmicutes bacterium]|nr:16S rRNA (adenine(1518)-N(6)/adenine(1519)-N(6))-dimethyltransferase [Bacillota bacterium]